MAFTPKDMEDKCWIFEGTRHSLGWRTIKYNSKTFMVHRLSYENYVGVIPKGQAVAHTCKNKQCWNPRHLRLVKSGSKLLNSKDMSMIRISRSMGSSVAELANEYKISTWAIYKICDSHD